MRKLLKREFFLSLLKKTNKDVVGILEFDDRIIYEPIGIQAQNNDYYVRKNINKEYAKTPEYHLYRQMGI